MPTHFCSVIKYSFILATLVTAPFADAIDLNNVRSAIHAWNDLIEIAEEIEEGDVLGVVGNSGMLALDLVVLRRRAR